MPRGVLHVGEQLRQLRQREHLSLRTTAALLGVAPEDLTAVERGACRDERVLRRVRRWLALGTRPAQGR
jgi:transcriptional regulator with XRE-family HTH domain